MERYSTLWGTEQSGPYRRLGSSRRLGGFLTQRIGAEDSKDVVLLTERIVTGIGMLPGYEKEDLASKPLAVVYTPLYLQRYPNMPSSMKCFCALGVSGLEHREVRESSFSHTWFFPKEDMLADGEFNCLDLVMGTPLTTNRDVALHREGALAINFDQPPHKVLPALSPKDVNYVISTIETLYQKKNVVLILEEGASFNSRAMQLLTEIYSLMQPVLATETGFATYQSQQRILELSADTNVQIYVVPAGADLSELPADKFRIMDLAEPIRLERTPVAEALSTWMELDWWRRCKVLKHLFADSRDYLDAEAFVRLTSEFVRQYQDLNKWIRDSGKDKTVTTIAQLQAEDKTATDWRLVPWAEDVFKKRIPVLLKDSTVEILNARSVAEFYEYNGADQELKERSGSASDAETAAQAVQLYKYGRSLANVSEAELCRLIWEKADRRLGVGYREQLDAQQAQHDRNVAAMQQAHSQELREKNEAIVAQSLLIEQKETAFRTALSKQEQTHLQELERQKTAHDSALAAAVAEEAARTASVQARLDAVDQVHQVEVAQLNQLHQANMEQQKQQAENELSQVRQRAETELSQVRQQAENELLQMRQQAEARIRDLEAEQQSLHRELEKSDSATQSLQDKLRVLEDDRNNLQNELLQVNNGRQSLQEKLNALEEDRQSLQNELLQVNNGRQNMQERLHRFNTERKSLQMELEQVNADLKAVQSDLEREINEKRSLKADLQEKDKTIKSQRSALEKAEQQIGSLSLQYQQATGLAPRAHVPTIRFGPFELPKAVVPLMAAFAAAVMLLGAMTGFTLGRAPKEYGIRLSVNGRGDAPAAEMGSVRLAQNTAEAGEMVTVDVTPAEGWQLEWIRCKHGNLISRMGDNEYAFVMPKDEEEILVYFTEIPKEPERYELQWSVNGKVGDDSGEMGIVTLDQSTAEADETITVTVVPAEGWELAQIACESGAEITQDSDGAYSFRMPEQAECVHVSFVRVEPEYIDARGGVNWEAVQKDVGWIDTVVTDPAAMEALSGLEIPSLEGFVTEAVLLPENWDAADHEQLPPSILQLRRAETGEDTAPADAKMLLEKDTLVLDDGKHVLLVRAPAADLPGADRDAVVRAAVKVMDLLSGTEDRLACFSFMLPDERIVDLQAMMGQACMPENWWLNLDRISTQEQDKLAAQSRLGTKREVSLVLLMADDTGCVVLNYADKPDKAEEMLRIAGEKDQKASRIDDFVLIVLN